MKISSDACDVLNERLVTLGLPSVVAMSQSDLNSDNISPLFLTNCDALLKELGRCDKSIPSNKTCTSLDQIYSVLKSRLPYFSSKAENVQFKLLQFLIAEIQVERLTGQTEAASGGDSAATEDEMEVEDDEAYALQVEHSILAFQLDKICKLLQVPVDPSTARGSGVEGVLEAVQRHVSVTLQQDPTLLTHRPASILPQQLELNAQQRAKLGAVEEMLHKDFALRRVMLIKRMEVTVESFLWSEKTSCRENEDEIRTAVRAQQEHLAAPPRRYQLIDALEANVALLHEQSKKITGDSQLANTYAHHAGGLSGSGDTGGRMKSIIKQILIGSVPDRGGRANEVRPKQLRADVRRAFGGGGGGGDRGNKRDKKGADSTPTTAATSSAPADGNNTAGKKGAQNKAQPGGGKGDQERSQSAPSNPTSNNHNSKNNNNKNNNKNNHNDNKSSDKPQGNASGSALSGRKVEVQPTPTSATSSAQNNEAPQGQKKNDKPQSGKGGRKR